MKARVRRPGSSAAVTASAVVRRTSRSGDIRRLSAISSDSSPDLDLRHQLGEQARPGAAAGLALLGEELLLGLGEQVRPVAARGAQVVAREVEARVGEQLLGARVVERRPLELEEQRAWSRSPCPLGDLGEQRAARGVAACRWRSPGARTSRPCRRARRSRRARASPPRGRGRRARRACRRSARRTRRRARRPRRAGARRPRRPRRRRGARGPRRPPGLRDRRSSVAAMERA